MSTPPKDEPLLALDEIQGNVIPGFLKDHQHFFFFTITDVSAARSCLGKMHGRLSTAAKVLRAHAVWKSLRDQLGHEYAAPYVFLNVALSATGLAKLTSKAEVNEFEDDAFKLGLAQRSSFIGDPDAKTEPGHISGWVVGGPSHPVDGVLIMASDDLVKLADEESKKLIKEFSSQGMSFVHEDRGDVKAAPAAGHEQFGFKDGVSHPAIRGRWHNAPYGFVAPRTFPADKTFDTLRKDFAEPGRPLVWPGHFLFGYGRQKADDPRTYDPANQPKGPVWAKNGSLMVYRRLRQNIDEFRRFVDKTAKALARKHPKFAPDKQRLAAILVGRWPSGTPLVRSPDKDIGITGDGQNHFAFVTRPTPALPGDTAPNMADPDGLSCPLAAHIRKVNPRDQATELGFAERTPPRSLLRRGITYAAKGADKGLIFVAYQSSLVDQFEFLMKQWVNQEDTPRVKAGHDPILAQGRGRVFNLPIGGTVERLSIPEAFVTPTGGEYFFSPSITFFKNNLAGDAKK